MGRNTFSTFQKYFFKNICYSRKLMDDNFAQTFIFKLLLCSFILPQVKMFECWAWWQLNCSTHSQVLLTWSLNFLTKNKPVAIVRQRYVCILYCNVHRHFSRISGWLITFHTGAFSTSSPLSYPEVFPLVEPCQGDRMVEAWSLMMDQHFQSLPFALQCPPSLCEIL